MTITSSSITTPNDYDRSAEEREARDEDGNIRVHYPAP
jgi:hypothetical protein